MTETAKMQPKEQSYYVGDVVEFKVGGCGVIDKVKLPQQGSDRPISYSTEKVEFLAYRRDAKNSWHYDGDISRLVSPSGIRALLPDNPAISGKALTNQPEIDDMKNLKRSAFALSVLIALLTVTSCGKQKNNVDAGTYSSSDFAISCLYGHKYMIRRVPAGSYIAPVFNSKTHLPEPCSDI